MGGHFGGFKPREKRENKGEVGLDDGKTYDLKEE